MRKALGLLLVLPLIGAGCSALPIDTNHPVTQVQPLGQSQGGSWKKVEDGLDRLEYTSTQGVTVVMYRLDPAYFTFQFEASTGTHGLAEWFGAYPNAALMINGVYFHDDNMPSGFLVTNGRREGDRAFDMNKSGMIDVSDGSVRILDTSVDTPRLESFNNAAQSYPFYFKGGEPSIKEDTQLTARRSFIGKDQHGNIYIGVVPVAEISLYQAMQLLDETDVDWANVINLDGGPSTGLFVHGRGFTEELPSLFPVPNVLTAWRKY